VLFIHGLTDHPGRHFSTARMLSDHGYGVTLFDLAGHGGRQEPLERSVEIYRCYALCEEPSLIDWTIGAQSPSRFFRSQYSTLGKTRIQDHRNQVNLMMTRVLREIVGSPDIPLFLAGFSMGGLLAADSALRWDAAENGTGLELKGVLLLSPAFRPQGRPSNRVENLVIDAVWSERDYKVAPIRFLLKSALQFNVNLDTSWGAKYMSDLPEEVELYRRDPLIPKSIPSAYASSIESLMAEVDNMAPRLAVDSLFVFPGNDGITSLNGGLAFARRVESGLGSERCRVVQYHGVAAHDLTRSSVRDQVRRTILDWLDSKAKTGTRHPGSRSEQA
jgi:alpha-beta hydrolase superfamily lysophospholipase